VALTSNSVQSCVTIIDRIIRFSVKYPTGNDPPPTKWSDLRYVFDIKEDCNGKEAIQA